MVTGEIGIRSGGGRRILANKSLEHSRALGAEPLVGGCVRGGTGLGDRFVVILGIELITDRQTRLSGTECFKGPEEECFFSTIQLSRSVQFSRPVVATP